MRERGRESYLILFYFVKREVFLKGLMLTPIIRQESKILIPGSIKLVSLQHSI